MTSIPLKVRLVIDHRAPRISPEPSKNATGTERLSSVSFVVAFGLLLGEPPGKGTSMDQAEDLASNNVPNCTVPCRERESKKMFLNNKNNLTRSDE